MYHKIKNYEIFSGKDLEIADLIQRRRYQILIHSCIYYHLGDSLVHDGQWDEWARELMFLQQEYPQISEKVTLHEYFKDWDAVSGFYLPITLDWVVEKAQRLIMGAPIVIDNSVKQRPNKKPSQKRRLF